MPLWIWLVDFGALSAGHHNPMRTAGYIPAGACTPVTPAASRPGRYQEGEMPALSTAVTARK
ncbi:MAG: hypothetical protein ACTIOQ_14175 [Serratia grimesii]|uniref:hypothetical protein n=1 Tax=Serratia grimesii TaxID=82995 RepID=UPI003F975FB3